MTPDLKPAAHGLKRYDWSYEESPLIGKHYMVESEKGLWVKYADLPLLSPPRAGMTDWREVAKETAISIQSALSDIDANRTEKAIRLLQRTAEFIEEGLTEPTLLMEPIQGPREWETMETAPKDGTQILCFGFGRQSVGKWNDDRHARKPRPYWSTELDRALGDSWARANQPTHWMHLPVAPQPPEKQP